MENKYTDVAEEYQALRQRCGLIDYQGAGVLRVQGDGAAAFLGEVTTRVVDFLLEGQISAALVLDDDGTVVGEVLMHCNGLDYILEVWPAQSEAVRGRLAAAAAARDDVELADLSASTRVFGVEGPDSFRLAGSYLSFPVASMAYSSFVAESWQGRPLLLARTGVSGEYGYKFHVPAEAADDLRAELVAAGAQPVGLEALDICRMEMRFVNLEQEGSGRASPFDVGLQWMVDLHHDFAGRDALMSSWQDGLRTAPVCWQAEAELDPGAAMTAALEVEGEAVGVVTHAVFSPALERVIGTARVERDLAASGLSLTLGDGLPVRTISAPFLVASSFKVDME